MKLLIDKSKYKNFILLMSLFLLMVLCFELVVKDLHVFRKIKEKLELIYSINFSNFSISLSIVICSCIMLTLIKIKDFSYSVGVLFLIFSVFPSAILFAYVDPYDTRIFISHILLFYTVVLASKIKINVLRFKVIETVNSTKLLLIFSIVGITPFVIVYLPHINIKNLFLIDIYETRAIMGEEINNIYLSYTYSWMNRLIVPSLLVFSIYYRKRKVIFFSIISIIFLFLCGANKIVFVGLVMVVLLYRFEYLRKINFLLKFIIIISCISLLSSLLFDHHSLMELSVRRNFMLPGLLDIIYFDFFDDNHLLWSSVVNGLFIDYPYPHFYSYVLGEEYFGTIIWSANNGVISNSFANFGIIGNFINIIIIGMYFSILNQLNISSKFFGIIFLMTVSMYNSPLSTILLTHGGILLIFIAVFFMKNTAIKMV